MNYLKLNIGGKERGAKLGLFFLENIQKGENMNVQELSDMVTDQSRIIFTIPKFIYYSLLTNCQIKGEKIDFTISDVYDWVEEEGFENENTAPMIFWKAFADSLIKLVPEDKKEEVLGKQKPAKKASTHTSGKK